MDIVLWLIAGAALGWAAIEYFGFNAGRGTIVSIIIGAAGGVAGGELIAPMFSAGTAVPGEFSVEALIVVLASSAACLALGNLVHKRYGV